MNYTELYDGFMSDVKSRAMGEVGQETEAGRLPDFLENCFTECLLEALDERGVADGAEVCYYFAKTGKGNVKMNAWAYNEDDQVLTLCITLYSAELKNKNVPKADIEDAFKQLDRLFNLAKSGFHQGMEQSAPVYSVFSHIYNNRDRISKVDYVFLTNGNLPSGLRIPMSRDDSYAYGHDCWDLVRYHKIVESEAPYESITIDLTERFGEGVSCLPVPVINDEHSVHLAVIPGRILCDLYEEYGQKLLDLNVRSFLQVRGKVNKSIRETLCKEPLRFLAYNNGITATVEAMVMVPSGSGHPIITSVTGFQVVNGGQTMASIHRAAKIDGADISDVYVQAKITEMKPDAIAEMAPKISRFANSQNKVSDADFTSNDPYHVELQRLSERSWAPGEQTRWFYERTRGQFHVERNRKAPTPAKQRKYDQQHPTNQRFTKTDVAKFENSWEQKPYLVSMGAQKNFVNFMSAIKKDRGTAWLPDENYFKELVAKAIIFKTADKIASAAKLESYKANVVTYMVAYLSFISIGRIDLLAIWTKHQVSESIINAFKSWATQIHKELIESAGTRNVTEWCKKQQCWVHMMNLDLEIPKDLRIEMDRVQRRPTVGNTSGVLSAQDKENIAKTMRLSDRQWFDLAGWGRSTGLLKGWQSDIAMSMSTYAQSKWETVPSARQALQAVKMIEIADVNGMPGISIQGDEND